MQTSTSAENHAQENKTFSNVQQNCLNLRKKRQNCYASMSTNHRYIHKFRVYPQNLCLHLDHLALIKTRHSCRVQCNTKKSFKHVMLLKVPNRHIGKKQKGCKGHSCIHMLMIRDYKIVNTLYEPITSAQKHFHCSHGYEIQS